MIVFVAFLMSAVAFFAGMVFYHDVHVVLMNRDRAKKRRQRDHRAAWCQCKVV